VEELVNSGISHEQMEEAIKSHKIESKEAKKLRARFRKVKAKQVKALEKKTSKNY